MIQKYEQFVSESFLGTVSAKMKELTNKKTISVNDQIADKWIRLIVEDWRKKRDPLKVGFRQSKDSVEMNYVLTNSPSVVIGIANRDEGDIDVTITWIKSGSWSNDISGARLSVTRFVPYRGDLLLVGRRSDKLGQTVVSDDGLNPDDHYSYINISQSKAKKIIEDILGQIEKDYPVLKGRNNIHYTVYAAECPDLRSRYKKEFEEKKRSDEENYKRESERIKKEILDKSKVSDEDLRDMVYDLEDEHSFLDMKILKGIVENKDGPFKLIFTNLTREAPMAPSPPMVGSFYQSKRTRMEPGIYYVLKFDMIEGRFSLGGVSNEIEKYLKTNRRVSSRFEYVGKADPDLNPYGYSVSSVAPGVSYDKVWMRCSLTFILRQK
jgi:hypothetical protein